MRRFDDWPERLEAFLCANRARPFQYGEWDCFQFARHAVLAITGADLAQHFRPYRSRFGYQRQMLRYCQSLSLIGFAESLCAATGFAEGPVEQASRGDLVVVSESDPAFGVVALNGRSVLTLAPSGEVIRHPLNSAIVAWRI